LIFFIPRRNELHDESSGKNIWQRRGPKFWSKKGEEIIQNIIYVPVDTCFGFFQTQMQKHGLGGSGCRAVGEDDEPEAAAAPRLAVPQHPRRREPKGGRPGKVGRYEGYVASGGGYPTHLLGEGSSLRRPKKKPLAGERLLHIQGCCWCKPAGRGPLGAKGTHHLPHGSSRVNYAPQLRFS